MPRTTIRHACATLALSKTFGLYRGTHIDETAVIAGWLVRLTTVYRSWGFSLCFLHLRNVQQFDWYHERAYRIYRSLDLNLRNKPKKRLVRATPTLFAVPDAINQTWWMDFIHD